MMEEHMQEEQVRHGQTSPLNACLSENLESLTDYTLREGLEFGSEDEAWTFYNNHARIMGFSIRKEWRNVNKKTGEMTSRIFTCSKEGVRGNDKRDYKVKNPRAETRLGCNAHMLIRLNRGKGKYLISRFKAEHNHPLHITESAHLMRSQRTIDEAQGYQIELTNACGIKSKSAHELAGRQAGGKENLGYTRIDQNNYLTRKRQRDMRFGEAGAILEYFRQQTVSNPSFYHDAQLDVEEQITNFFWADARMIADYDLFGDVVSFDTTYRTNRSYRPLAVFTGFNNHRQTVIFGAALLYDETTESFEWLFSTFLKAMSGKKPQTIFTDQAQAIANAISSVMPKPGTYHQLCTWHLMQNALKKFPHLFNKESDFQKDFHAFIYEIEEEQDFLCAWDMILSKHNLRGSTWMEATFNVREKWAKAYVKNSFSGGSKTTQLSESLNGDLRNYLKSDLDLLSFLKHFEREVDSKRYNELKAEYDLKEKLPRLKMKTPMLIQAGEVYTKNIFEEFQTEYELYQAAYLKSYSGNQPFLEYVIGIYGDSKDFKVFVNPIDQTVSCACRKFETEGIMCSHAIKVLDLINVKIIPDKYILKRWRKDAKEGQFRVNSGVHIETDSKVKATNRYQMLCPNLIRLATRAAESEETSKLVEAYTLEMSKKVEGILRTLRNEDQVMSSTPIPSPASDPNENMNFRSDLIQAKGLKKKEPTRKGNKRLRSFLEKSSRKKKKMAKTDATPHAYVGNNVPIVNDIRQSSSWMNEAEKELLNCHNFTEFLTASCELRSTQFSSQCSLNTLSN